MSIRAHYSPWGAQLDERAFACALASAGACEPAPGDAAEGIAIRLLMGLDPSDADWPALLPWRYRPPDTLRRESGRFDPAQLADGWDALIQHFGGRQPRLRVDSAPGYILPALVATLDLVADTAWLSQQRAEEVTPSWPIRIGLLDDPASRRLRDLLERHDWHEKLFTLSDIAAGEPANLLLMLQDLRRAAPQIERTSGRIDADAVILLGGTGRLAARDILPRARYVQGAASAGGIAILGEQARAREIDAITAIVAGMSHGLPIDVALGRVAEEVGAASPFMLFDPRVVERLNVNWIFENTGRRLEHQGSMLEGLSAEEPAISLPDELAARLGVAANPSLAELGRTMVARSTDIGWTRELDGASILAELSARTEHLRKDTGGVSPRFLQARIAEHTGQILGPRVHAATLLCDREYVAAVRVGHSSEEWQSAGPPVTLPPFENDEPHRLQVWFWEPRCAPEALLQQLNVPPVGDSLPCYFPFRTPGEATTFRARIVVVHRGTILQAGELTADIGEHGDSRGPEFRLIAMAQASLDDLAQTRVFDRTLFVDRMGTDGLQAVASSRSAKPSSIRIAAAALDGFSKVVGSAISRIAESPQAFSTLEADQTQRLLRHLAQHGAALHQEVTRQLPADWSAAPGSRINIAAADDAYFPAEFVYAQEAPEDTARLCTRHRSALERAQCCGECQERPGEVICPLGFWGLSCVIERQTTLANGLPAPGNDEFEVMLNAFRPTDPIYPLRNALLGASDKASAHAPDVLEDLRTAASRVLTRPVQPPVADWNQWVEVIRTTAPSTLVILPHHEYRGGFEYLQLGAETTGDRDGHPGYLKSLLVKMKHVKSRAQDPGPVVLLLGCETQVARISFESFVSRFRTAGAAVVIATLATVLGRDAGPVAKVLLDELSGATEQRRTIGDVVLSAKRKLLLQGIPMALGITTYGGADRPLQR